MSELDNVPLAVQALSDIHLLHHAGFDRRFHNVPGSILFGTAALVFI